VRDYASPNTCPWTPSGSGTWRVCVHVKEDGASTFVEKVVNYEVEE
jgi:hypothetical protein